MRKTLRAFVLVSVLCCPALAGETSNPPGSPEPPPPNIVQEPKDDGIIHGDSPVPDGLTETVLGVFGSVLALF